MSANQISAATNTTNSAHSYVTSDRTELAPLCSTQQDTKGLRVIISCFTVFSILVSMALMTQLYHGDYQVLAHGSVVSDNRECSKAGVAIMRKGGSAVDAVISTLFCLSVALPHLVGIGGGGYLLVYDQQYRGIVGCMDFQPATDNNNSIIGVPGFVAGLYKAHEKFGKLPWSSLLNSAIELAGSGFTPSESLLSAVPLASGREDLITLLTSGQNPQLFATLQTLALAGSDELYNGSLTSQMEKFVSLDDLVNYKVVSDTCLEETVGQYRVSVAGSNSGGPLLLHLLRKITESVATDDPLLKVALNLKDTIVVSRPYSNGVNVVAADHNDIYVSAVSGLGSVLGSQQLTPGGYIMNNNKEFSSVNLPKDGSLHPTLASPVVLTQIDRTCGSRFIMGASDVRDAAQLLVQLMNSAGLTSSNISLESVLNIPRVRISKNLVQLEKKHDPQLDSNQLSFLTALNYSISSAPEPYPSLNVIHKIGDAINAAADSRGGGSSASF